MPPVNQGSRTALITWTVVTSFLFVIATIFAIYYYVDSSRMRQASDTLAKKYQDVLPEVAISSDLVESVKKARDAQNSGYNPSQGLFEVAVERSNRLAKLVSGPSANNAERAMTDGEAAIKAAAAKIKPFNVNLPADNLISATNLLADTVAQRSTEAQNARKQADEAVADATKKRADADAQIKSLTDELEHKQSELQQAQESVTTMTASKDEQLQQTAAGSDEKLKQTQEALDKANQQVADKEAQIDKLKKDLQGVQSKLSEIRPDVNRPVLSQADGKIVRLPGAGTAFIDLGRGDQIIAGMTFEVYDRIEGIPPVGDPANDVNLPKGKGSIEVVRVGQTSSECRIVNAVGGQAMTEGDLIANLIYDKNTKNKFLVYGNFDLTRSGKPNAQDAEVIKRLITQWGGEVVNDINVDTDFVVLGAEPVIPVLTREEREDPVQKAMLDKAQAEADAYNNISSKARDYRIPILNQNRFLYMIGYYELSRR